jgi:hypothetical protein
MGQRDAMYQRAGTTCSTVKLIGIWCSVALSCVSGVIILIARLAGDGEVQASTADYFSSSAGSTQNSFSYPLARLTNAVE